MFDEYCWYEGAWEDKRGFHRHIPVRMNEVESFLDARKDFPVYLSTLRYSDLNAVLARSWTGRAIGDFWIDIDGWTKRKPPLGPEGSLGALSRAANWTLGCALTLKNCYGVDIEDILIWFSGMKGFHICVPYEVFGAVPSERIHLYYKYVAKTVCKHGLDLARYSLRQLWRAEGSRHGETRLFKVPLSFEELSNSRVELIERLASSPRQGVHYPKFRHAPLASKLFRDAVQFEAKLEWWMTDEQKTEA